MKKGPTKLHGLFLHRLTEGYVEGCVEIIIRQQENSEGHSGTL